MKQLTAGTLCVGIFLLMPILGYGSIINFDSGTIILNEFLADGNSGDANGDGTTDSTQDEFIELVNITGAPIDISSYTISESDQFTARHTFPVGTILNSFEPIVIFGGGTPVGFSGIQVQVASNSDLGIQFGLDLSNAGDQIILRDPSNNIIFDIEYDSSVDDVADQSLTRSPDLSGVFVGHDSIPGAIGAFSPGTQINGSPIAAPVPVPASVWLFGSGLAVLIGLKSIARKKL